MKSPRKEANTMMFELERVNVVVVLSGFMLTSDARLFYIEYTTGEVLSWSHHVDITSLQI
jgi:hypothetical protein